MRLTDTTLNGRGGLSRVLALVLAACMLFALAAPLGAAGGGPLYLSSDVPMDVYEPDNSAGAAGYIPVNAPPQPRTIHEWMDEDWARFDAVAGNTYVIETTYPGGSSVVGDYDNFPNVDTWLELYAADGTTLLETEYIPYDPFHFIFSTIGSTLMWEATETGPLYARVTSVIDSDIRYGIAEDDGSTARSAETDSVIGPGFSPEKGQYLLSVSSGTGMISGKVTADDTGGPVEGVEVYAFRENSVQKSTADVANLQLMPPGYFMATTAADGTYALRNLPAGVYGVYVSTWDSCIPYVAPNHPPRMINLPDGAVATDVDFEMAAAGITGRVTDSSGDPLRDVQVYIRATSVAWTSNTYTNNNGCYAFRGSDMPTGTQFEIRFSDDFFVQTYQTEWYDDAILEASATPIPVAGPWDGTNPAYGIDAVLDLKPAIFSGTVTDMSGAPLANHPVRGWLDPFLGLAPVEATTDVDGKYTMRLDATYSGPMTVTVEFLDGPDNKHMSEFWENTSDPASATPLVVTPGTPITGIDAALMDIPPYLEGTVTDQETGDALKGIECWLYRYDMYNTSTWVIEDYVRTGADGAYAFAGPSMIGVPYRLRFYDPSDVYASEYWDDQPTFADADDILLGSPAPPGGAVELTLPGTFVADAELGLKVPRSEGEDRYIASVNVARDQFPEWEELTDVIVAAGEDEAAADALAAAGLSWAYECPVLLASKTGVSNDLLQAISDMGPNVKLHVAGGVNSLPDSVVGQIAALSNVDNDVDRIWGPDRYSTAVAIAERVDEEASGTVRAADAVLIANGSDWEKFFDALALSAPSANTGLPILLVQEGNIPASTAAYIDSRSPSDVFIAGGPATVSSDVMADLVSTGAIVQRWAGPDRYGTAVAVANGSIARSWIGLNTVGVAAKVPDAMSGGAAIGRQGGPLVLTGTDVLPSATEQFLSMNKAGINSCTVFGGPASVSEDVRDQIAVTLY